MEEEEEDNDEGIDEIKIPDAAAVDDDDVIDDAAAAIDDVTIADDDREAVASRVVGRGFFGVTSGLTSGLKAMPSFSFRLAARLASRRFAFSTSLRRISSTIW